MRGTRDGWGGGGAAGPRPGLRPAGGLPPRLVDTGWNKKRVSELKAEQEKNFLVPFFSSPVVQSFATATYLPPPRICLRTASTCHRSDPVVHCRSATPLPSFTVVHQPTCCRSLSFSFTRLSFTCRSRSPVVLHLSFSCRSPAHLLSFTVVLPWKWAGAVQLI